MSKFLDFNSIFIMIIPEVYLIFDSIFNLIFTEPPPPLPGDVLSKSVLEQGGVEPEPKKLDRRTLQKCAVEQQVQG